MKPKIGLFAAALGLMLLTAGCYTVIRVPSQTAEAGSGETDYSSDEGDDNGNVESDRVPDNDRIYYGYGPNVEFDLFWNSPYWWRHPVSGWGWNSCWDPWDNYWSPYGYGYTGFSWYPSWYSRGYGYGGWYDDPFYRYWGGHYWGGRSYTSAEMKKRPFTRENGFNAPLGGPSSAAISSSRSLSKPSSSGGGSGGSASDHRIRRANTDASSGVSASPERRVRNTDARQAQPQSTAPAHDTERRERRDDPPPPSAPSYSPPPSSSGSSGSSSGSSGSSGSSSGSSGSSGGRPSRH